MTKPTALSGPTSASPGRAKKRRAGALRRWASNNSKSIKARNSKSIVGVVSGKQELDSPWPTKGKMKATMPGRRAAARSLAAQGAEHKRSFARPAVDLRRFGVHRFERHLSEAKFRRTSGALAQGAAADAVDRRRLSKSSWPARLILFRWASHIHIS